jgi:hypothetical protein
MNIKEHLECNVAFLTKKQIIIKTKLILFLLTILPVLSYSQFIFTGDMLWSTMDGPGDCYAGDPCISYYTKITNDTIINGIQYKQVVNSTDSLMNEWTLTGFLREEGQKVFYRKKNADKECLLYDFGCSIGDTLDLDCTCFANYKFKVDSIKYLIVMGESRKHIYLTYLINDSIDGPVEYWIEGIGSIHGILNGGGGNNCMTGFHEGLLCCFKDGIKIYGAPGCDVCYFDSLNSNSQELIVGHKLRINVRVLLESIIWDMKGNTTNSAILKLMDINGKIRHVITFDQDENAAIDKNGLESGIYIYQIITEEEVYSGKIFIN